jgi:epoxyqueuosine reductase
VPEAPAIPVGRVERYAWGGDYHAVIEERLETFRQGLTAAWGPGVLSRPAVDAQPLLERAFARRGGLGFIGKNTNLIRPGVGSFLFLADVLVNLDLPPDRPLPQGCGGCVQCAAVCPTGALAVPFSLDARRCVSFHTIENRGGIPRDLRPGMGSWLFGCDDCQEVCPFNARAKETLWPEFRADRGPGAWVPLRDILEARTREVFQSRFGKTSLARAKRAGLVRNACVVAANRGHVDQLRPLLEDCLRHDAEAVVRGHAAWALGRGLGTAARPLLERALSAETDASVRDELTAAWEGPA